MGLFLPSDKFTVTSQRSREEVSTNLRINVQKHWSFDTEYGTFIGKVSDTDFKIRANSHTTLIRNSFGAVIEGAFTDTEEGCRTEVRIRLPIFQIIFQISWLIFFTLVILVGIVSMISEGFEMIFIPIGAILMIAVGTALAHIGYRLSAKKAKERLIELLS